jgi:hypothetical protein
MPSMANEVWLKVLSHCDYQTLKVCCMVSKNFFGIVTHPLMVENLFRGGKIIKANHKFDKDELENIIVHPAFNWMVGKCEDSFKKLKFVNKPTDISSIIDEDLEEDDYSNLKVTELKAELKERGLTVSGIKDDLIERLRDNDKDKLVDASRKEWLLIQTKVHHDFATMPPMESLLLKACDRVMVPVKNPRGVTVNDVLDTLWDSVFEDSAWSYMGKLNKATGKRNGMKWADWEDHEPDDLTFAQGYLAGVNFRGLDGWKLKQGTKEFVLCWKEQAMKDGNDKWVKTVDW